MPALAYPFDSLPPQNVTERQILWAIYLATNGGDPSSTQSVRVVNGASFDIPEYNSQEFVYLNSTNNIGTQIFKNNGSTVATLIYSYVNGAASDDDLIQSITQS